MPDKMGPTSWKFLHKTHHQHSGTVYWSFMFVIGKLVGKMVMERFGGMRSELSAFDRD